MGPNRRKGRAGRGGSSRASPPCPPSPPPRHRSGREKRGGGPVTNHLRVPCYPPPMLRSKRRVIRSEFHSARAARRGATRLVEGNGSAGIAAAGGSGTTQRGRKSGDAVVRPKRNASAAEHASDGVESEEREDSTSLARGAAAQGAGAGLIAQGRENAASGTAEDNTNGGTSRLWPRESNPATPAAVDVDSAARPRLAGRGVAHETQQRHESRIGDSEAARARRACRERRGDFRSHGLHG